MSQKTSKHCGQITRVVLMMIGGDDRWRLLIIYRSIEWVTCRFFLQFSVCVMDVCVGYIYITCVCVMFHPRSLLFKKNDDDDDDDDDNDEKNDEA